MVDENREGYSKDVQHEVLDCLNYSKAILVSGKISFSVSLRLPEAYVIGRWTSSSCYWIKASPIHLTGIYNNEERLAQSEKLNNGSKLSTLRKF